MSVNKQRAANVLAMGSDGVAHAFERTDDVAVCGARIPRLAVALTDNTDVCEECRQALIAWLKSQTKS